MYDLARQFFSSPLNVALTLGAITLALLLRHLWVSGRTNARIVELEIEVAVYKHTASLSDARKQEVATLRRELSALKRTMRTELDRISTTAQKEVADAQRDAKTAKGRAYPDAQRRIARGAFSHVEDTYVDGRPVTTVHFKNGSSCGLPIYWAPTTSPGTYIDIFFNFKTGVAHAEPVVGKATAEQGRKKVSYLTLVGRTPRPGEEKSN